MTEEEIKQLKAQLVEAEKYGADMERYCEYLLGRLREVQKQMEDETKLQ